MVLPFTLLRVITMFILGLSKDARRIKRISTLILKPHYYT
jgi:hypothetical protein